MGGLVASADTQGILRVIDAAIREHRRFRLRGTDERWLLSKQDWQLETVMRQRPLNAGPGRA